MFEEYDTSFFCHQKLTHSQVLRPESKYSVGETDVLFLFLCSLRRHNIGRVQL